MALSGQCWGTGLENNTLQDSTGFCRILFILYLFTLSFKITLIVTFNCFFLSVSTQKDDAEGMALENDAKRTALDDAEFSSGG